jgi:exodeoxyribonuclease VII large subunit
MPSSAEQIAFDWRPQRVLYTVSELTQRLRVLLEAEFADIWVAGEISGVKLASSGHYYFTLKDEEAQLQCVCFRSSARLLKFKPQDGIAVVARGRLDVFEGRGQYQLLVETLEPRGYGALQLAFEQLRNKLAAEGLFDAARKRPLPRIPWRLGIVTSPDGAVIRDMLNILERRFPGLHIRIYPALVQGEGSCESVCRAIRYFSESRWADVVIVARGGGSLEDLWTFNEELVAREIASCSVPVVSAVGHETDFTIADFVADLRAPTPSAAAELVVCTRQQLLEQIAACERHLVQSLRYIISRAARRLDQLGVDRALASFHRLSGRRMQLVDERETRLRELIRRLLDRRRAQLHGLEERLRRTDLRLRLLDVRNQADKLEQRACAAIRRTLNQCRTRLETAAARLEQLSPLRVLERGYALVQDRQGRLVKDAVEAPPGTELNIRLAKGSLRAEVR